MARVDWIKEEIGWLKVPFGLLAVVDASLLGWLAQSYSKANFVLLAAASAAAIVVTSVIFQIIRIAYRPIDDLEKGGHGMVCHYPIGCVRARVGTDCSRSIP